MTQKQAWKLANDAKLLMSYQVDELKATGEAEEIAEYIATFLCKYHGWSSLEVNPAHTFVYDYIMNNWSEG